MTVTQLARRTDRTTSKVAGKLAENSKIIESWVLTQFHDAGAYGLTDLELTDRYRALLRSRSTIDPEVETARKRRSSLTGKRLVLADNTGRTRKGRRAEQTVWVHRDYLTPKGSTA